MAEQVYDSILTVAKLTIGFHNLHIQPLSAYCNQEHSIHLISTIAGVIGWMSIMGTDLDPCLIGCILMAIGFSVDFTAHIAYHYYATG